MKQKNCCKPIKSAKDKDRKKGFLAGIVYGLIPHAGCITFILFAVFGVTFGMTFFGKILAKSWFFYALIGLSLIFATISATIYLKRNSILSVQGIKRKWKYLSILYGTTIFINLIMFLVIFPYATGFVSNHETKITDSGNNQLTIQVQIPCSGHAPLIITELQKLNGIGSVKYRIPNLFDVNYDSSKISETNILNAEIFKEFKATLIRKR
jgi:hypothetical protein